MPTTKLTDQQWEKVRAFLHRDPNAYVGSDEKQCRCFVEAVAWMSLSGAQRRLLPQEYGSWNTVYRRFYRWCKAGVGVDV
jgi:putative transposase